MCWLGSLWRRRLCRKNAFKMLGRLCGDTQKKPLGELKADSPAKRPPKAQKEKASEMATGGTRNKKSNWEREGSNAPPPPPPPSQVYITPPSHRPLSPSTPKHLLLSNHRMKGEGTML